jgi:S1-C subfamily serine protease
VNALDLGILATALAAAIGGWSIGLLARVLAWAGVAVGLAVGIQLLPRIASELGGTAPDNRLTAALVFLVLTATIGQVLGIALGNLLRRLRPASHVLPRWDRIAGAAVGVLGVLALVWMTIPSLATATGWPARVARDSSIVSAIERFAPEQPARFAAWGRIISEAPFPSALRPLDDPPDPGAPPRLTIPAAVDARVRRSTVKVEGRACRQIQEGSGWVAEPGLVVTNAHVVAGERTTEVEDPSGRRHDATVVAFDPVRDLAVLEVDGLSAPPLPLGEARRGTSGAVYGHPGGGPLRASPARVGEEILAVGTDIYRTAESRREVLVLAAALEPGDSGAAMVDERGTVVGVAFAVDPGRSATAYAVTDDEVRSVLRTAGSVAGTGPCLVD